MARKYVVNAEEYDDVGMDDQRKSLNIRIDNKKFAILEQLRDTGFGHAAVRRNRSDLYNEALGHGIQVMMLRHELGDKVFDQVWRIINRMDFKKLNLDKIEAMLGAKE
jgi:hypothetical protein